MIVERALAKVNLALHVLGRRADGYHLLDSVVGFADVGDEIALTIADRDQFSVTGPFASSVPTDASNLVVKALHLMRQHADVPPFVINLQKNLPVAGGIGGGSADAAAILRAVQKLLPQPISDELLRDVALLLGADVPVCLAQTVSRMRGIGEVVDLLAAPPFPAIVLINPNVSCLTASVFQQLGLATGENYLEGLNPDDPTQWRNDLYEPALRVQPIIAGVLMALEATSLCNVVRMSGSGATCFGLTDSLAKAQRVADIMSLGNPQWWVRAARLQ